jgi:hypothetical protein
MRAAAKSVAGAIVGLVVLDLAFRQIARISLLASIGLEGQPAALTAVAALATATLVALHLATPPRRRRAAGLATILLSFAFAAGLTMQLRLGARLQSDGFYYFAYLRSLWFDGDVNFMNDYRLLGLGDKTYLFEPTPTGHAHSAWTIGPSIVWSPFFAIGHLTARRLEAGGRPVATDGTSYPYRQAICVAGLFYGLLGVWFTFRLAALFVPGRLAAVAAAVCVGGSFMLWYLVKEPSMTHAPSMAAVAAFVYVWALGTGKGGGQARLRPLVLGLLAGLMTLIRWQNAIFVLLPAADGAAEAVRRLRQGDRPGLRRLAAAAGWFTAAGIVAFLPQLLAWKAIYGTWLAVSPVGPRIRWSDPHLVDILWSSRNGLFSTSPVLYCAAIGLAALVVRRPAAGLPMIAVSAAMIYFNSIIQDWWGSDGYGMRRFDGLIPILAVGLAMFVVQLTRLVAAVPSIAIAGLAGGLVIWNLTLMHAAVTGRLRIGEGVSMGVIAQHQASAAVGWFGHPFSWPVNLIYAWRNRVPPSSYDLLGVNRFLADPARPYGRIDLGADDGPMVAEGWHAPERDGPVTFRWARASAELLVPLDHPADLLVQVRLRALPLPDGTPQQLWIDVNGERYGPFRVDNAWHAVETLAPQTSWRSGVNRVRLTFARATRPADAGLGGDTRTLAAAVDYVRVQRSGT